MKTPELNRTEITFKDRYPIGKFLKTLYHIVWRLIDFIYSGFHIKGNWSVHSFNGDYLSIPKCTGSFMKSPVAASFDFQESIKGPLHFAYKYFIFLSICWIIAKFYLNKVGGNIYENILNFCIFCFQFRCQSIIPIEKTTYLYIKKDCTNLYFSTVVGKSVHNLR